MKMPRMTKRLRAALEILEREQRNYPISSADATEWLVDEFRITAEQAEELLLTYTSV